MGGVLDLEGMLEVGSRTVFESVSPENDFGVVFEDEGETGYFYALDATLDVPILDELHIYNVADVVDKHTPSKIQIAWSYDGLKSALILNDYVHAVFDFEANRGYCRTGFPPIDDWSKEGHAWDDKAVELFR